MTTSPAELAADKLDAELRETEAKLQVAKAKAEAKQAKADMDEISGLAAAKDRVKKNIADLKQRASADYTAAKKSAEQDLRELQAKIERFDDRYSAWDEARERRFNARLDEATARAKAWKARDDRDRAVQSMQFQNDLATLEEKIATAKARAAEARRDKYTAKAQAALDDAERNFERALEAAKKRYV
jgi:hypothetical protein